MDRQELIQLLTRARWFDLTQALSIFTPPWPGEMPLQVHFFKRLTGSFHGGQGANGQLIEWSNNTGCHLVGPRAFHSGERAIADIPLTDVCGPGVVADISEAVADYGLYTPEMITERVEVREGDILIVNTGYHRYAYDQPDVANADQQGGIENKEFGYYVRHPGTLARVLPLGPRHEAQDGGGGLRLGRAPDEHQRALHARAGVREGRGTLLETHGKSWEEMFPPEEYRQLTHSTMPKAGLLLAEALGGEIDALSNQRAWIMIQPIPFMEVESAWSRAVALQARRA